MPLSEMWNPTKYNPLAMQMATSMMGSQGGPGRMGAIRGAAEKILGALMARGQQREYGEDLDQRIRSMLYPQNGQGPLQVPDNRTMIGNAVGNGPSGNVMGQVPRNPDPGFMAPGVPEEVANPLAAKIMEAMGQNMTPNPAMQPPNAAMGQQSLFPNFTEAPATAEQEQKTTPVAGAQEKAPVTENPAQVGERGTVERNVGGAVMTKMAPMALSSGAEAIARAALNSNDIEAKRQAAEILLQHHSAKNPMTPDKRFMNLGDGRIFDVLTQKHIDSPWKPPETIDIAPGHYVQLFTPDGPVSMYNPGEVKLQAKERYDPELSAKLGAPAYRWGLLNTETGEWKDTGEISRLSSSTINQTVATTDLTKSTTSDFQKKQADAVLALGRLNLLDQGLEKIGDYILTTPGQWFIKGKQAFARLGLLPEGAAEKLTTEADFLSTVKQNANLYIKAITGAQMSAQEADRLIAAIPYDTDDPNTFRGKLQAVIRITQMCVNAYNQALSRGATLDEARADFDAVMNDNVDEDGNIINDLAGSGIAGVGGMS